MTGAKVESTVGRREMKAIRIDEFGGPEVMGYEDVEVPEPGPVRCASGSPPQA